VTCMHCLPCAEVVYGVDEIEGLVASAEQCALYPSPVYGGGVYEEMSLPGDVSYLR
jgi:hypothetical protein